MRKLRYVYFEVQIFKLSKLNFPYIHFNILAIIKSKLLICCITYLFNNKNTFNKFLLIRTFTSFIFWLVIWDIHLYYDLRLLLMYYIHVNTFIILGSVMRNLCNQDLSWKWLLGSHKMFAQLDFLLVIPCKAPTLLLLDILLYDRLEKLNEKWQRLSLDSIDFSLMTE